MAKHESGQFTSRLFLQQRNAFGMGTATKGRKERQLGRVGDLVVEGQRMQEYDSVEQSTRDLLDLLDYNRFPTDLKTVDQFAQELRNDGYYTDSVTNYTRALKRFLPASDIELKPAKASANTIKQSRQIIDLERQIAPSIQQPKLIADYRGQGANVFAGSAKKTRCL